MFGSTILLPAEYNLARASEEREKARLSLSPAVARGHIELAMIFERRAALYMVADEAA
jgi:hypothetical protein